MSFPGREGGPAEWLVDGSSPTLSPSSYKRLKSPTIHSKSSSCYRKVLLKPPTRKRVLSPFQGDTMFLSFPEREGGPCACTVDGSSTTPSPSSYKRSKSPTIRSKSFSCYRKILLKTPYPQAGPFPLSGGHNIPQDRGTHRLLSFPGREGGPCSARWMGPALHFRLRRTDD